MHHAGRYGQAPDLAFWYVDISNHPGLFEADQAGTHHTGGLHRGSMRMIAAHFIGLGEHHVHVLLTRELRIGQRLEHAAARITMRLDGLHDNPLCARRTRHTRRNHASKYNRAPNPRRRRYRGGGRRPALRRVASSTPTMNIMSSQSRSPPPPLLLGTVTVREADAALAALLPAGAVESAFAAIKLV